MAVGSLHIVLPNPPPPPTYNLDWAIWWRPPPRSESWLLTCISLDLHAGHRKHKPSTGRKGQKTTVVVHAYMSTYTAHTGTDVCVYIYIYIYIYVYIDTQYTPTFPGRDAPPNPGVDATAVLAESRARVRIPDSQCPQGYSIAFTKHVNAAAPCTTPSYPVLSSQYITTTTNRWG